MKTTLSNISQQYLRVAALVAFAAPALGLVTGCEGDSDTTTSSASQNAATRNNTAAGVETQIIIQRADATGQQAPARPAAPQPACDNCGRVTAVTVVDVKGESSGAGAVLGAVVGGVIGHQFGSGSGNDAATAGGAVAGGVAGNEIERNRNSRTEYEVTVSLDGGGSRTVRMTSLGGISGGDRVRVSANSVVKIN